MAYSCNPYGQFVPQLQTKSATASCAARDPGRLDGPAGRLPALRQRPLAAAEDPAPELRRGGLCPRTLPSTRGCRSTQLPHCPQPSDWLLRLRLGLSPAPQASYILGNMGDMYEHEKNVGEFGDIKTVAELGEAKPCFLLPYSNLKQWW